MRRAYREAMPPVVAVEALRERRQPVRPQVVAAALAILARRLDVPVTPSGGEAT